MRAAARARNAAAVASNAAPAPRQGAARLWHAAAALPEAVARAQEGTARFLDAAAAFSYPAARSPEVAARLGHAPQGFWSPRAVRRDCLDHVVVLGERDLRRVLTSHVAYYHGARCHLGLDGDAPEHREPQPPAMGKVIELPEVGGLHHRYERQAA